MKIFNVGLMVDPNGVVNGFQTAMQKVATGGYLELNCGGPTAEFNQKLLQMCFDFRPDIVFIQVQAPNILFPDTVQQISRIAFIMNFSGDVRHGLPPWYLEIGRSIQLSTFSNMLDVKRCMEVGVNADWLEIGYDPEKYQPWQVPLSSTEIVAHFNDYGDTYFPLSKYRREIVETLQKEFGSRFGVFGNFPGAKSNFNNSQPDESRNYAAAKIAINCSHFCIEKYSSDRLLRALGSGVMVLSHRFPAMESMYEVGTHLDVFDDVHTLVEKVHYYLAQEQERKRIALAGQQYVKNNFTFDNMAENIVSLYQKHKK